MRATVATSSACVARRLAIGGVGRRRIVVGDDRFEKPRQGVAAHQLRVDVGAASDVGRQFARRAGEVAGEKQRLTEAGRDRRILAAPGDGASPVHDRLRVAALIEAEEPEAEGRFGEPRVMAQRSGERAFGGGRIGERVGDQRQPEPGAGEAGVEREDTLEHGTRLGGLSAGVQRRGEIEPQRRVVGAQAPPPWRE